MAAKTLAVRVPATTRNLNKSSLYELKWLANATIADTNRRRWAIKIQISQAERSDAFPDWSIKSTKSPRPTPKS